MARGAGRRRRDSGRRCERGPAARTGAADGARRWAGRRVVSARRERCRFGIAGGLRGSSFAIRATATKTANARWSPTCSSTATLPRRWRFRNGRRIRRDDGTGSVDGRRSRGGSGVAWEDDCGGAGGRQRSGSSATSGRPPGSLFAEGGAGARALNKARLAGERRDGGGLPGLPARRSGVRLRRTGRRSASGGSGRRRGLARWRITTATGRG